MKFINNSIRIFTLALLISFTSCSQKYPDLEEGLYAEFVTNKGTMVAKLFYQEVPVTVANFVALAEGSHPELSDSLKGKPFYNGLTFHRVMNDFMIQGGDPTATGSGGPGYKFYDEFDIQLRHNKPGILSMANSGPNSNGSQFFITEKPTPWLDAYDAQDNLKNCEAPRTSCHSVFGELVIGMDVQDSISNVQVNPGSNKPLDNIVMSQVNIIRKGSDAKAFDAAKIYKEEAPKLIEKQQKLEEERVKMLKESAAASADKFLEANKDLGTVKTLDTGVVMVFKEESNGVKPTSAQNVLIDCAGYFENGKLFWTTWKEVAEGNNMYDEAMDKKGGYAPFSMPYNETAGLIPGFREAMLHMKIGDKVKAFIPSYLGYGDRQYGPIPPNTNLIFDIELVEIKK